MTGASDRLRWMVFVLSLSISVVAARYFVLPLSSASGGEFGRHLTVHGWLLYAHAGGGAVALLAGALQWLTTSRIRRSRRHRWIGLIYVAAIAIGGLSGIGVAMRAFGGFPARAGFATLAVVWMAATARAYRHARLHHWHAHRAWMVRSFALTFAAVTLRIWLPALGLFGVDFAHAYPVVAWLCWVPNLAVAEWRLSREEVQPALQLNVG